MKQLLLSRATRALAAGIFLWVAVISDASADETGNSASERLARILDEVWENGLKTSPMLRLIYGHPITELPDDTLDYARKSSAFAQMILAKLEKIPAGDLAYEDGLSLKIAKFDMTLRAKASDYYWLSFNVVPYQFSGSTYAPIYGEFTFNSRADLKRYLRLIREYADLLDQVLDKIVAQDRRGIRIPKPEIPAVLRMLRTLKETTNTVFSVDDSRLGSFSQPTQESLRRKINRTVSRKIHRGYAHLISFFDDEYTRSAPEAVGLRQYPGGEEYYRFLVRQHTTLDLTPEEIHARGLEHVAQLSKELESIRSELNFSGSQQEFHRKLNQDPRFFAKTPEEVGERLMAYIRKMEPLIDTYFATEPKLPYGVRRLDPADEGGQTFGFYQMATSENPIGEYRFNGSDLDQRTLIWAGPMIYHELIPGHHFHIGLQTENESLSDYRKNFLTTAYTEGWANYAGELGTEAVLMTDPHERYGWTLFNMFISTRLVVDTGMNYLGWSLKQARDFMGEHTFQSDVEIASETLRYAVSMPGQALAYKIGLETILDLRQYAEDTLDKNFDIRKFHTAVLGSGAMPLAILEEHVNAYIESARN